MKIIFKTETDILREIDFAQMTSELIENIQSQFDEKPIAKYEMTFVDGVKVKDCHNLDDVTPKIISVLTITLSND